jgi:hypothetical protein
MGDFTKFTEKGFHVMSVATIPAMEAANKTLIPVKGSVQAKMRIGYYTTGGNEEILLMDNLSSGVDLIIGMDLLHKHGVSLHLGTHEAVIGGTVGRRQRANVVLPASFFNNSQKLPNKFNPIRSAKTLQKLMKTHNLCLAWWKRDADGKIMMQSAPFSASQEEITTQNLHVNPILEPGEVIAGNPDILPPPPERDKQFTTPDFTTLQSEIPNLQPTGVPKQVSPNVTKEVQHPNLDPDTILQPPLEPSKITPSVPVANLPKHHS